MNKLVLIILVSFYFLIGRAQSFSGNVEDTARHNVEAVSVTLLDKAGKIVAFTKTDSKGKFSINTPENKVAAFISFRLMGFAPIKMTIEDFKNGQTVMMSEEGLNLKEVKVTAQRIKQHSDTLIFSVDGFKQQQDRSIADVIKKMPGLDVENDGKITYQGKAINEFTVEGMDLTNGKYAQISENLSADKVKSVEIRENNQPKKVLRDVQFSDQAALNLVLKDDAKNVWQGLADIKAGITLQDKSELLHDTRVMTMMFGKKSQSVSMVKTNNTGKDIQIEVTDLLFDSNALFPMNSLLSNIGGTAADIDRQRYTFNNSMMVATNWLFKTRGNNDLRFQASYFFDKNKSENYGETVFHDISGGWALTEDASVTNYASRWNAELQYKVNNDKMYLNNRLKANMDFDRSTGWSTLNGNSVREWVQPRSRFISDAVEIIKKMRNGNSYTLSSAVAYDFLPGKILICDNTSEKLNVSALRWNSQASFRHQLWKFNIAWNVGADITLNKMEIENSLTQKTTVRYNEQRVYTYPGLSYDNKRLRINVNPKLSWLRRCYESKDKNDLLVEPIMMINYKQNSKIEYGFHYLFAYATDGMERACDVPVFTSYRAMSKGNGELDRSCSHNTSAYVRYHHITHGLFANASVSYHATRHSRMYASKAVENIYQQYATDLYDNTEGWTVSANISKSFSWAKTIIKAEGSWNNNNYHILIDNAKVPYQMQGVSAGVGFSMKPIPLISIEEKSTFSHSTQKKRVGEYNGSNVLNYFEHKIRVFLLPGKWQIEIANEWYHSNDHSVSLCHFADASVAYRTKSFEIGLWLDNILGADKYERRFTTTTQEVFSITKIRPRQLMAKVFFNF